MSRLDEMLAAGRSGAAHVESGRFRLDWKKALDKIKEFQLVDPHRWVLEVVQGAVAGGASAVTVTTDSDDVVIAFDGATPDAGQLESLFDFLFASGGDLSPLRQLALGINAVLAMKPRFIRVDVGDGATGHRLELSGNDDLTVRPLTEDVPAGVRVHVRDRSSWRRVAEMLKRRIARKMQAGEREVLAEALVAGGEIPTAEGEVLGLEGEILAAECRWCPIPITLDGKRLNGDFTEGKLVSHRFAVDGLRGILALRREVALSQLTICMNGVRIVDHRYDAGTPLDQLGLLGVIDDPGLSRTASHSGIHRDARWHALLDRVAAEALTLVDRLCRGLADGSITGVPEVTLVGAARLVLHRVTGDLPPGREILLDLLQSVELATSRPPRCTLRMPWEDVRRSGRLAVATRRRVLPLDSLAGMVPVLGPAWVIELLGPAVHQVDELLGRLELAAASRMQREALRRPPELFPEEAFVRVPLADRDGRIRGELGLNERLARSLQELGSEDTDFSRARGVYVVYCREGVPLGVRWLDTDLWRGAAVVESPDFAPDPHWKDVITGPATRAADQLIAAAVPLVAQAVRRSFEALPPPEELREVGAWTAEGTRDGLPEPLAGPIAPLAAAARRHIDAILQARTFDREASPWLWSWGLFHLIDGTTVSLEQVDGRVPVDGEVVPAERWRLVPMQPWGQGAPAGLRILNVTPAQRGILQRHLGRPVAIGSQVLLRERAVAAHRVTAAHNKAQAARRRQPPTLAADDHEVIVDLELPSGRGQLGLLRGDGPSVIRILVDELPLVDLPLDSPVPVRGVVESPALSADAAFAGLADPAQERAVIRWVRRALPRLMARFAGAPAAGKPHGQALVWNWLEGLAPKQIDRIPPPILDLPLVPVCGGERLSLRAIRRDAAANRHSVRVVATDPGRALPGRPILVCGAGQRTVLRRVLPARIVDFARNLERQLVILDRKKAAARKPRLDGVLLARAPLRAEGYRGEVGLTTAESGWVDVLLDGVPVQRRPLDIDGLPLIGVVSSSRFTANAAWTGVHSNEAWNEALRALRDAADRLVIEACAIATGEADAAAPLRAMLRVLCGRRFAGRPDAIAAPGPAVDAELAAAPVWDTAAAPLRVSLSAIAAQARRFGSIWVVGDRTRHTAEDEIILRCARPDREALVAIWHDRVLDGARRIEADEISETRLSEPVAATAGPAHDIDQLHAASARREFLTRTPVAWVDLDALSAGEHWLHRRRIEGDGWEGELGIPVMPGHDLIAHIHVERRPLAVRRIQAPLGAVAAVQWSGLAIAGGWDRPAEGDTLVELDRRLHAEACRAHADLAAECARLDGAALARARAVLLAALASAPGEGDGDLRAALDAMRGAPLFEDTRGRRWSVAALMGQAGGGRLRAIWPATLEGHSEPIDSLVLVIDGADWPLAVALLPVYRDDPNWIEECAGHVNRRLAATTHGIPRGALAVADVQAHDLRGRLALSRKAGPGSVALFSGGRMVEVRLLPEMPGLVGWLDGPLPTNRRFRKVRLAPAHVELLKRMYDERLAAAVELAHAGRRRGTWQVLSRYVRAYLGRHLDALGGSFRQRRDRILTPDGTLPEPLRRALACPVFQVGDGNWVPIPALLGAERPRIVIGDRGERNLPAGAVLVRGAASELVPLMAGLVGSGAVQSAGQARASARAERERAEGEAREQVERQRRQVDGAVLVSLRAQLRALSGGGGKQFDWVRLLVLHRPGPDAPLVDCYRINSEHPLFLAARTAHVDRLEGAIPLLALAVIDEAAPPKEVPILRLRLAERLRSSPGPG